MHFEDLWEDSEKLHLDADVKDILNELILKINLYQIIDSKSEIPDDERIKVKSRTMGEILLTLTNLSFKDNINVYNELKTANQLKKAEMSAKIPKHLKLPKF